MYNIALGILKESWNILNDSAHFILFGLFISGIIKIFISEEFVEKHLGSNSITSVLKASLMGIPLPICSCGVVPVSIGLRKQGASKGATTAFMISTPETGVDSISITYALLDPVMTVIRPISAFITAFTAGIIVNLLPDNSTNNDSFKENNCTCSSKQQESESCCASKPTVYKRAISSFSFAFQDLLSDIGTLLMVGFIIAGTITYFVPDGFIENNLGAGIKPMLIMLVVGIPLYVCATASTPIVAALAMKGLSPGAAIVFLLAGPATNAATITVVANLLGKKVAVVYVVTIASVSLLIGYAVNSIYNMMSISISNWVAGTHDMESSLMTNAASILLILLIVKARLVKSRL
jgi:uncharacterized membrane protein YraQ (UPF0718 family)